MLKGVKRIHRKNSLLKTEYNNCNLFTDKCVSNIMGGG